MKRVIALIISVAMIASLATGLAVTSFAATGTIAGLTLNGTEISGEVSADGNTLTISGLRTQDVQTINIPAGKKLIVSTSGLSTYNSMSRYIVINGPGEIEINCPGGTGISANGYAQLNNVKATINAKDGIYCGKSSLSINNSDVRIITTSGKGITSANETTINYYFTNSKVDINSNGDGINNPKGAIFIYGNQLIVNATGIGIAANKQYPADGGYIVLDGQNTNLIIQSGSGIAIQTNNELWVTDTDGTYANVTSSNFPVGLFTNGAEFVLGPPRIISTTNLINFGIPPKNIPAIIEREIEESDPDVEIDFGYGPVTVKTSGKSLVLNDKKIVEKEVLESNNLFVPFDVSNTPVKIDGIFLNNDVYKYISGAGKGIELKTRFAKADVFKKDDIGQNPVSLHLSDVSEEQGKCATAIQKAAMQTSKIYAEVNYSFVSNGKPTENDAKIYVPVDGPAKVFYLFNAEKIGIVPCEVKDGYCIFDRYFDGTYVVCATK